MALGFGTEGDDGQMVQPQMSSDAGVALLKQALTMEYFVYLPPKYREAFDELTDMIGGNPNTEEQKKLFDEFSKKYTMLPHTWRKRIRLESGDTPENLPFEVFVACLKARKEAFKHFYHPWYIQSPLTDHQEKQALKTLPPFGKIYRLPYAKRIWSFCDVLMKQTNENFAFDFLKQYLVFPHDQLYRFNRVMQKSDIGKRILDDVSTKEKYDAAIKSYNYMISIAMDSEKWLEWMKETFEKKDWALNLECKISEHFFMKEIWFFYIELLDSQNKVKVLDVYKRYCRLFIEDKDMQMQYSEAIKKYDGKFHVFRWECDLEEFQWDFETKQNGCPKLQNLLEKVPDCICKNCFGQKNAKYFDNKLKIKKDKSILSKIFKRENKKKRDPKIKNCLLCYDLLDKKDDMDLSDDEGKNDRDKKSKKRCTEYRKAINFQPVVKINFSYRNGLNLPLPKPIFDYIVQNANEKVLSKFYECLKYFFVKRMHLLCGSIYVGTFEPEFVKTLYYTTVEGLTNLQVKKLCSGTNFVFFDRSTRSSLTPLIPKLCFCSLVNVALVNQDLTLSEFDLIIGGGNLEQIDIDKTAIINDDGSYLTVEEIIEKLPNVAVFSLNPISPTMFTPSTTEKLSKVDRTTKFEHFEIWNIPNTFELTSFIRFMERHMVPRATMLLLLTPEIDDNYENMFSLFLNVVQTKWNPIYAAPQINQ